MSSDLGWKYYLQELTSIGQPPSRFQFASDEQVYKMNPDRYNFYIQLLQGLGDANNPELIRNVLTIEQNNRFSQERLNEKLKEITSNFNYLFTKNKEYKNGKLNETRTHNNNIDLAEDLDHRLKLNPFTRKYYASFNGQKGGGNKYDELYENVIDSNKEVLKDLDVVYKNDPVLSPDNEKITATDRVIFIAVTYVLRALSLFVVKWALSTYMISSFQKAFNLYVGTYVILFMLLVLLVNNGNKEFLFFRMLFFYLDTSTHAYGRIIVHIICQLLFLPVPMIVRDSNLQAAENDVSFVAQRHILRTISNFSMFIWLLTTVIAIKY